MTSAGPGSGASTLAKPEGGAVDASVLNSCNVKEALVLAPCTAGSASTLTSSRIEGKRGHVLPDLCNSEGFCNKMVSPSYTDHCQVRVAKNELGQQRCLD